jgi:midasin (ATPase involved in ribosome maturation)
MYTLERIARCVQMNEPVLLCGETGNFIRFLSEDFSLTFLGCGKTTLVQYLAQKTGRWNLIIMDN